MPGSVRERWAVLRSVLARAPHTRRVRVGDALRDALGWYGLRKRRIARSLVVRPAGGGLVDVDVGPYAIHWPRDAALGRLSTALVELWAPSNSHFYFREPTPVRAGDAIVDVGACEGAFALECLLGRGAGRVWCFEPGATMARALRETAARNGVADRLTVVQAAVGAEPGTCTFFDDPADPLVSRIADGNAAVAGQTVRQYTLDEWAVEQRVERVDYVKIDAEGSDLAVLEGARALLARWRPRIAVTTYHEPEHCEAMIAYLDSLRVGYRYRVSGAVAFGEVARPVMLHAAAG